MKAAGQGAIVHTAPPAPSLSTSARERTPEDPVRVIVADDQLAFREVARDVLRERPEFALIAEAASGSEALATAAELKPDLVLLDVRMPDIDGVETARRLSPTGPATVVVLISVEEPRDVPAARTCGAAAFVRKQDFGP